MAFISIFGFLSFINKQIIYAMLDIQGIALFNSFDSPTNRVIVATLYCIHMYIDWPAYLYVADVSRFHYLEFG